MLKRNWIFHLKPITEHQVSIKLSISPRKPAYARDSKQKRQVNIMTQTLEQQTSGLYLQNSSQQIAFPLKHTEVKAKIAGNISRVEVTQSFENPFTTTLEAVYIFPLPDEAAVDDMLIRIGDRTIQGSIKNAKKL